MSGYHYNEQQGGCGSGSCYNFTRYSDLANTATTGCLPACMDRFSNERSAKDQWLQQVFVDGRNMPLPPSYNPKSLRAQSNCMTCSGTQGSCGGSRPQAGYQA